LKNLWNICLTFSTKCFKLFAMAQNQNHALRNIQCHKNVKKLQAPWWVTCSHPAPKSRLLAARQNALDMMAREGLCRRSDLSMKIVWYCFHAWNKFCLPAPNFECKNFEKIDHKFFHQKKIGCTLTQSWKFVTTHCDKQFRQYLPNYRNCSRRKTYHRKVKVNGHEKLLNWNFWIISSQRVLYCVAIFSLFFCVCLCMNDYVLIRISSDWTYQHAAAQTSKLGSSSNKMPQIVSNGSLFASLNVRTFGKFTSKVKL